MLIDVRRLGPATLGTEDMNSQVDYYVNVLGLHIAAREESRIILCNTIGEANVILEPGKPGLRRLSFIVPDTTDLKALKDILSSQGVTSDLRSDVLPGVARVLSLVDPGATHLDIYANTAFYKTRRVHTGVDVVRLGHVARFTTELKRQVEFYRSILGFRVSDWRQDESAFFLRCGPEHHTVNFFKSEISSLHHIAFEMRDFSALGRACDILASAGMRLDWGPSRHVIGHNIACYHSNGDGIRVELFTEMDQMRDEELGYFEPRPWHEDFPQRPRAWGPEFGRDAWGLLPTKR